MIENCHDVFVWKLADTRRTKGLPVLLFEIERLTSSKVQIIRKFLFLMDKIEMQNEKSVLQLSTEY